MIEAHAALTNVYAVALWFAGGTSRLCWSGERPSNPRRECVLRRVWRSITLGQKDYCRTSIVTRMPGLPPTVG